jgi:hypothetical protein
MGSWAEIRPAKAGLALLLAAGGLSLLLACPAADGPAEPGEVETFEGELSLGRLSSDGTFEPYARDVASGRYFVDVVLGLQGAYMVVVAIELPEAQVGERVDYLCWLETDSWTSLANATELEGVLVGDDALLLAPYLILGWWEEQATDATLGCRVSGPTREDATSVEVRLTPQLP